MPSLRISIGFLLLIFTLFSCGGNSIVVNEDKDSEELPKVDATLFRTVEKDGFKLEILKEMTENRVSGTTLFDADYLPKEYHFTVKKTPATRFKKDASYPTDENAQLHWFAKREVKQLEDRMRTSKNSDLEQIMSNKKFCFKQTVSGKEYGFPLEKIYFLRFFKSKEAFITVSAWTVQKEAKDFEKLAQYMGMKFQRDH